MSHRSGSYEMNIYGDPSSPSCVEIGINPPLLDNAQAKANCRSFIKSILTDPADQKIVDTLKEKIDSQERNGITFEVTPPTAEDAYGGWWISVYSTKALDESRASAQELAEITTARKRVSTTASTTPANYEGVPGDWSDTELQKSRPPKPVTTVSPQRIPAPIAIPSSGLVYVRGYTRKDGTYVQPYTRRAPSR
jgi:hypothetical protein